MSNQDKQHDVIIVGAGPAGVGVAIVLQRLGINYIILEKNSVGSSFKKWPKETQFISPSFTGNFFGMPDLNSISPDTSPAYNLLTEHPNGQEYAKYLKGLADFYELAVETKVDVKSIEKKNKFFSVHTNKGLYKSTFVIWAAGEYQYPKKDGFEGSELCTHYADVKSFAAIPGKEAVVIGGYESGFDSAINLIKSGKDVTIIDSDDFLHTVNSDSSYSLSPCTRDRMQDVAQGITYHKKTRVTKVGFNGDTYTIHTTNKPITTKNKPINCTGFARSLTLVQDQFEFEEGYPLLNDYDESAKMQNFFLVGPHVKHSNALFCFIYKYRQRFAIVAERIAKRMNISKKKLKEIIDEYRKNNFYMDDLSCCDDECAC